MNDSNKICKMCGRNWCPHDLRTISAHFDGYLPDWTKSEWFLEICGGCSARFMTWALWHRGHYNWKTKEYDLVARPKPIFNEGEYYFTLWLRREFAIDLKNYECNNTVRKFCKEKNARGFNCRVQAHDGELCLRHSTRWSTSTKEDEYLEQEMWT